ncbi:hypothetical protein SPICUR_04385 [Spiribacter curvatus]|uniref:DUF2291 domain-containing protein n=1 Tax=Spiribacter curvatus TaxID=1335757 RepID=U5T6M5_9GAMM|nr:DUF2291 domain-containing protein [Spiribacter curvatus]AGY91857.1 hypothetical protein SPICUR_04385 [Spiribacter curvatus]
MAATTVDTPIVRRRPWRSRLYAGIGVAILGAAIAVDTTVVQSGSEADQREMAFNPAAYGAREFPRIREFVIENAVEAATLSEAIQADRSAASDKYGVDAGVGAIIPVNFVGTVDEGRSGVFTVSITNLQEDRTVRVQLGPAVNGTDLRDATGTISFGEFTNQIEYQDAASGINDAMKAEVLDGLARDALPGQRVEVTGVFKLINPDNWFVTPVALEVQ